MDGRLCLRFDRTAQATTLRVPRQDPPWKVLRGFTTATGECLAHLNNVSGGVLGGDRLEVDVEVSAGAQAQITTTGATRIYAPRPESADSLCSTRIRLGEDALLEYLPDPVIPFRDSRAEQRTRIDMEQGATLFWWEVLAPGRVGHGECFDYECLRVVAEVWADSVPILVDRMSLEPRRRSPRSPVRFGARNFLTTIVIAQVGAPQERWRDLERQFSRHSQTDGVVLGVSALPTHGILIRGLSESGLPIAAALYDFWRAA